MVDWRRDRVLQNLWPRGSRGNGGAAFDANTGEFVGIPSAGTVVHWADTLGLIRANKFILQYLEIANNAG